MMGTLATVLAKKKIRTFQDRYMATVTGDIEEVNGVLKITRIHVHYNLKLPAEKRPDAEEAFNNYITLCPAAQSVIEAINITHDLEMADEDTSQK
jgi:organic hydroperoxide reductase OsmC/OhrA